MRTLLPVLLWAALSSCKALPTVDANVCGNAVVEEHEDCDTFAPAGSACIARGEANECHFDCRSHLCPSGLACDTDNLCRQPSGGFEEPVIRDSGGAHSLFRADLDGDGKDDVISQEARDAANQGKLKVSYFGERGVIAAVAPFPKRTAPPFVGDLSGDGRAEVVFTTFNIGVLPGRADRALIPATFSSYRLRDTQLRVTGMFTGPVDEATSLAVLAVVNGVFGIYTPDNQTGGLTGRADLPGAVEELEGEPVAADLFVGANSPCDELVVALHGRRSLSVYDMCAAVDPTLFQPTWHARALEQELELPDEAVVDAPPLVVDVNGDHALDVLVGGSGRGFVAYGDGERLAAFAPLILPARGAESAEGTEFLMPLAAGEFTGDHHLDFVYPDVILGSQVFPDDPLPVYGTLAVNRGEPWTVARIADLNRDGFADVAVASERETDIGFWSGSGMPNLVPTTLPTDGDVRFLTVGDFDGDLVNDLAFIEASPTAAERDPLRIAFGVLGSRPGAAVEVARIDRAEQLSTYRQLGISSLAVSSVSAANDQYDAELLLLDGSPDRMPFAPYVLVNFSQDGQLFDYAALALTVGAFSGHGQKDLLALGSRNLAESVGLWLLPNVDSRRAQPELLAGTFTPPIYPSYLDGGRRRLSVALAPADVDGDGLDEAVWVSPASDGEHCGIEVMDIEQGRRAVSRSVVELAEPCPEPNVTVLDADEDGALDLAVISGAPGDGVRSLRLFWNDGAGHFSAEDSLDVNRDRDAPQALTVLGAVPGRRGLTLAYVTPSSVMLSRHIERSRDFEAPELLKAVENGSGIVAADIDGDRVQDLVAAASGNLVIFRGALETR